MTGLDLRAIRWKRAATKADRLACLKFLGQMYPPCGVEIAPFRANGTWSYDKMRCAVWVLMSKNEP